MYPDYFADHVISITCEPLFSSTYAKSRVHPLLLDHLNILCLEPHACMPFIVF